MSKYIRSDTGVFELLHDVQRCGDYYRNDWKYEVKDGIFVVIEKGELRKLRKSDRIADLCDECIAVPKQLGGSHIPITFDWAKKFAKNGMSIYGAIWTEKGLIYVAKMNEKGELELL